MVSSKQVAEMAGVSISTVSRVFSNPSLVNKKTLEKVLKIAEELNYVPDINARALKLNKSHIIGVIVSDISNPFYLQILKGIMSYSEIFENNYRFYITFSNEDKKIELASLRSLVSSQVDYVVFTPVDHKNTNLESFLLDNNLPALQLFRHAYDGMDSITIDDELGTYLATKELLKHNHSKILLIDLEVPTPTGRDSGYKKAYEEFGLEIDENLIKKISFHCDIISEVQKILNETSYTAVIPSTSVISNAVFEFLKDNNLKVKDDISIVSYDDSEACKILNVTAITQPMTKIVESFMTIFLEKSYNPNAIKRHIKLEPHIIHRDSIKKL